MRKENLLKRGKILRKLAENYLELARSGRFDDLKKLSGGYKRTYSGAVICEEILEDLFYNLNEILSDYDNFARKSKAATEYFDDFVKNLRDEANENYDYMYDEALNSNKKFIETYSDDYRFDFIENDKNLGTYAIAKEDIYGIDLETKKECLIFKAGEKVYPDYKDPEKYDYWLEDFDWTYEKDTWDQNECALALLFESGDFDFNTGEIYY